MNARNAEPPSGQEKALQRNLRLYPIDAALLNALSGLSGFFLVFTPLPAVGALIREAAREEKRPP